MIKIILATSNPHKLEEIKAINTNPEIVFDVVKENFNPDENGSTFKEKQKKQQKLQKHTVWLTIQDFALMSLKDCPEYIPQDTQKPSRKK